MSLMDSAIGMANKIKEASIDQDVLDFLHAQAITIKHGAEDVAHDVSDNIHVAQDHIGTVITDIQDGSKESIETLDGNHRVLSDGVQSNAIDASRDAASNIDIEPARSLFDLCMGMAHDMGVGAASAFESISDTVAHDGGLIAMTVITAGTLVGLAKACILEHERGSSIEIVHKQPESELNMGAIDNAYPKMRMATKEETEEIFNLSGFSSH